MPKQPRAVGIDCTAIDKVGSQLGDHLADLTVEATWEVLEQRLRSGLYDAVVASPPCSTFSKARGKGPGPRVVRSKAHPYGLPKDVLEPCEVAELK